MSKMNKNYQEREMILFNRAYDKEKYTGGCCWFNDLHLDKLSLLIDLHYANPKDCQNYAPSIMEIKEFLQEMELRGFIGWTAHGYAVSPDRDDYRISIEGVEFRRSFPMTEEERVLFENVFGGADEFVYGDFYARAWFD